MPASDVAALPKAGSLDFLWGIDTCLPVIDWNTVKQPGLHCPHVKATAITHKSSFAIID